MYQNQDFSALRNLLALKKMDMPQDTQVDQFLVEFHRRQRAQLLVPESLWSRSMAWMKERVAGFQLIPSLSYASAVAAIAILACAGLSQQVQVTQNASSHGYQLSFRMPSRDGSFAMLPGSFAAMNAAPKQGETPNFTPSRSDSATTRFVLADNTHGAYDATVAF